MRLLLLALVVMGCAASPAEPYSDMPRVYTDGCHLDDGETVPVGCVGGDPDSATTVYLFGDSHAAQWFPALDAAGQENGWRLVSHTKSSCPPWDVPVLRDDLEFTECAVWREAVLGLIEPGAQVFLTSSRRYLMPGPVLVREAGGAWATGMAATLSRLDRPVMIAETPWVTDGAPYGDESYATLEREVSEATGARLLDLCEDACPAGAFRDQNHLTATYTASLASRITGIAH